jgi:hypothetical protein
MGNMELHNLGPFAFQNLVNLLALKVLGSGNSSFGPGPDGGRDGYFEGEAPYPSQTDCWRGIWYIQSKFHAVHLSSNAQKWLIGEVAKEIKLFDADPSEREWPDNWIIATNVDPSGKPETGSFDAIKKLLKKSAKGKNVRLAIWGGRKILDLLAVHDDVARYYGHFLTPGHVLSELYEKLTDERASASEVIRYLVATQFSEHIYTKLDQAGSSGDSRPGVHDLFIDLPFAVAGRTGEKLLAELCQSAAQCHRYSLRSKYPDSWREWLRRSMRARTVLIKGGPGQGKSTVGQYLCQIQRASLILANEGPPVSDSVRNAASAVHTAAKEQGYWPASPRIPIQIELKEYAQWFSQKGPGHSRRVVVFIAERTSLKLGTDVPVKLLKRALAEKSWLVVFDGLDEVPHDSKEAVAAEVLDFLNDLVVEIDADIFAICTWRPQGYAGQFAGIEGPVIDLQLLNAPQALECAKPLLRYERGTEESEASIATLASAMKSASVTELMTTPLQSHIMAVVVRDGGRPPERRWALFNTFYLVMKKREGLKNFQDPKIAKLLREEDRLLKAVHMRLGFVLHARAETSEGAQTKLSKSEFRELVKGAVIDLGDDDVEDTVTSLMDATTERLVLVNTPENGEHVRFDIRQLQEFFAAEFIYDGVSPKEVAKRVECIGGDAHWREVMHFLLSALVENRRSTELAVATQVLRRLNEGEEFSDQTRYLRKTATATLLVARLLLEGVVEQDQRDRQQLRPLVDPISGIYDLESVVGISLISPGRSRQWLIQLLLERASTAAPSEYACSLFLLGWLAPDDLVISRDLLALFKQMSMGWQQRVLAQWAKVIAMKRGHETSSPALGRWVFAAITQLLNSEDFYAAPSPLIDAALQVCKSNIQKFSEALRIDGVPKNVADALSKCLKAPLDSSDERLDCGVVKGFLPKVSWYTGGKPPAFAEVTVKPAVFATRGYVRLFLSCVWFAEEHSEESFLELKLQLKNAGNARLDKLPQSVLALVPLASPHSCNPLGFDHLIATSHKDLVKSLDAWRAQPHLVPYGDLHFDRNLQCDSYAWDVFVEKLPRIGLRLVMCPDEYFREFRSDASLITADIAKALLAVPQVAAQTILQWGSLKDDNAPLLRKLIEIVSEDNLVVADWFESATIKPFRIDLERQAALLGTMAPAILRWHAVSQTDWWAYESRPPRQSLVAAFEIYGFTELNLRTIAESEANCVRTRAGAIALYWLLKRETAKASEKRPDYVLATERNLFASLKCPANQEWLTEALVIGVLQTYSASDSEALSFASELLEWYSDGSGPYAHLVQLIRTWRETSTAPVQARQVLQQWLSYRFQPDL